MGAPKGSQNALGNKGGGRKSHYQEKADAELLHKMFFGEMSKRAVKERLASGKYSLKDMFVSKGFAGNIAVLLAMFHKLFPDLVKSDLSLKTSEMTDEQLKAIIANAVRELGEGALDSGESGEVPVLHSERQAE